MSTPPPPIDGPAALSDFLSEMAESVRSRPETWENDTLERFLEAWAAWLADAGGWFERQGRPVPDQPTWDLVADMVRAARVYE